MKSILTIILLSLNISSILSFTPSKKQVSFLPLSHAPPSSTSFKAKQDTIIVYTPVDEITSVIVPYPCDIIYSPYYDICSSYLSCGSCLSSPYCGWCSSSLRCLPGTVSQVACPSACVATWLFTDYNSICTGEIVTQTITQTWVSPAVVTTETVYHTTSDNVVYVQIGTKETIVVDENLNEVIESVPIYAEYHENIPISQIETHYYTVSPIIIDNSNNSTNNTNNNSNSNGSSSVNNNNNNNIFVDNSANNGNNMSNITTNGDNSSNISVSSDNSTNIPNNASIPSGNASDNSTGVVVTDNSTASAAGTVNSFVEINKKKDNNMETATLKEKVFGKVKKDEKKMS